MSPALRLVSANLWNDGADPEAFADLVRTSGAHVACVQELGFGQAEALARVLPHGELEPHDRHLGMGIASARPCRLRRIPLPCRDARVLSLTPDAWPELGTAVELINVHVMGLHGRPLLAANRERRHQLRGLLAHLDASPDAAQLLVGDLNATVWMPVYRRLASRLEDAAHALAARRRARPERTWAPVAGWAPWLRIDHVLSRRVRVESIRVMPIPGGDHRALVIDFAAPDVD